MPKHNPNDIALLMDVPGTCSKCGRRGNARLVAYYSGEIIIRCNACKTAGQFTPDDYTYNDPKFYKPFLDDEDPDDEGSTGSGRYTKGKR